MKLSEHIAHCQQILNICGDGDIELRQWHAPPPEVVLSCHPLVVGSIGPSYGARYGIYPALLGQF